MVSMRLGGLRGVNVGLGVLGTGVVSMGLGGVRGVSVDIGG